MSFNKNTSITACFLLIIILITMLPAHAKFTNVPFKNRGIPFIKNFTYQEYMGHSQIWAIARDYRGVMYFGNTNYGVLEYDGFNWNVIPTSSNSSVRSLDADINGNIFVGSIGELGFLQVIKGKTNYISLLGYIPDEYRGFTDVWDTVATPSGIYFRTRKIIFRWYNNKMSMIRPKTEFTHRTRFVNGIIYVHQKDIGLMQIRGNSLEHLPDGDFFSDGTVNVMLSFDYQKTLLVSRSKGICLYDGKKATLFPNDVNEFLINNWIYCGTVLPGGLFAFGTYKGVVIIDKNGKTKYFFNKNTGLRDQDALFAFSDFQSGLWIGFNNGISRISISDPVSFYSEPSAINSSVNSILRHNGKLYVATSIELLKESYKNASNQHQSFQKIAKDNTEFWKLFSTGEHLFVAGSQGVSLLDHDKLINIESDIGVVLEMTASKSNSNRIYLGLRDGLAVLHRTNNKWDRIIKIPGIDVKAWTLAEDSSGVLWIGTRVNGIISVDFSRVFTDKPEIVHFSISHGLPEGNMSVSYIKNKIRVASLKGLYKFDPETNRFIFDNTFGQIFADPRMVFNYPLVEDLSGNVWIRYGLKKKLAVATPDSEGKYILKSKPFRSIQGIDIESVFVEKNGIAWLGSPDSLIRFDSKAKKIIDKNFQTIIRTVKSNNIVIYGGFGKNIQKNTTDPKPETQSKYILDYKNNNIHFNYAATNFENTSATSFRLWLEGFYDKPSPWVSQTFVDYTNLPEGKYRFHVTARNMYNHESPESVFEFTILPPWYRTWWAYFIYIILAVFIITILMMINGYRISKKAAKKLEIKEEKLRIKQKFIEASERFVPNEFLKNLKRESIVEVKLGDNVKREMTILFSDIRSFTTLSESMTPEENFKFINSYLKRTGPVIREQNGFIDKYIGDAIMALFEQSADDAVNGAIGMINSLFGYNAGRKRAGYIPIKIGIGINTGNLMLGTIGETHRMESTVISDAVNLAARIEGMTKIYGAQILISHNTYKQLTTDNFCIRFIDRVLVKGKSTPVIVWEIFDSALPEIKDAKLAIANTYEEAIDLYYNRQFTDALKLFEKCGEVSRDDKVLKIFIDRCRNNIESGTDKNWDGIIKLDSK